MSHSIPPTTHARSIFIKLIPFPIASMLRHLVPLTVIFTILMLGSAVAEDTKPPGPVFKTIPMTLSDKTGHYLGSVSVEGKEGRFLVDSGAGSVAILSNTFAQSLGTPLTELEGGTAVGGAIRMQKTNLQNFKIDGFPRLKLSGLQVVDLAHSTIDVGGKPIVPEGLIGAGLLDLCNAVFDPKACALLIPPNGTPDRAYIESAAGTEFIAIPIFKGDKSMPFVDITLQGKTRTFLIDTGAGGNSLLPDFAAELSLKKTSSGGNLGGAGRTTNYTEAGVMWQTIIHGMFILSAIGIAFVDRLSNGPVIEDGTNGHKNGHGKH